MEEIALNEWFASRKDANVNTKFDSREEEKPISMVSASRDRKKFALGFSDGKVSVFPEQLETQVTPALQINDISWALDDSFLLVVSDNGKLWKWAFWSLELLGDFPIPLTSVSISPCGAYAIAGADDGTIIVRDVTEGILVSQITPEEGHQDCVTSIQFASPKRGDQLILTTSWDKTIKIWSWSEMLHGLKKPIVTLDPNLDKIIGSHLELSTQSLVVCGEKGFAQIPFSPNKIRDLPEQKEAIITVEISNIESISQFKNYIILGFSDGHLAVTSSPYEEILEVDLGRHFARVSGIDYLYESQHIVTVSIDGTSKVWKGEEFITVHNATQASLSRGSSSLDSIQATMTCCDIQSYQIYCLTVVGRSDGSISFEQFATTNEKRSVSITSSGPVKAVAISSKLNFVASCSGKEVTLWIYHPTKPSKTQAEKFTDLLLEGDVTCLAFSQDERYILIGDEAMNLTLFSTVTRGVVKKLSMKSGIEEGSISSCCVSPSGEYIAAATITGRVNVWRCENSIPVDDAIPADISLGSMSHSGDELTQQSEYVTVLTFAEEDSKSDFLAGGTNLGKSYIWEINYKSSRNRIIENLRQTTTLGIVTQSVLRCYIEESGPILSLNFIPGGGGIVTSTPKTSKFWKFTMKPDKKKKLFNFSKVVQLSETVLEAGKKFANIENPGSKRKMRSSLEEKIPCQVILKEGTICSIYSSSKVFMFVGFLDESNRAHIKVESSLPVTFWQTYSFKLDENNSTLPVHWLSQRPGNCNAISRICRDSNFSIFYSTNDVGQVPYLFAVKCGDSKMMELTSHNNELEEYMDDYGRNAKFFSVFSIFSSKIMFQGNWYSFRDVYSNSPLHYAISNGHQDVVKYILFEVVPNLSLKEQKKIFKSYDSEGRSPLMLLIEKYPNYAKLVMDKFGYKKESFENPNGEGDGMSWKITYNLWLLSPHKGDLLSVSNKCAQIMVDLNRKELTSHPLSVFLYENQKWSKLVKFIFGIEFMAQILILAILVVATILVGSSQSSSSEFTEIILDKGWYYFQIIILVLALLDLAWRIYVPASTLVLQKRIYFNYRMVSYLALYLLLIITTIRTLGKKLSPEDNTTMTTYAMIQLLFMLNIMSYLTLFPGIGPVVLSLMNTAVPILYWASFFLFVFFAFSITMSTIAGPYSVLEFNGIPWTMDTLFLAMFGQGNGYAVVTDASDYLGKTLFIIYMILVPLIMFNVLVAMITDAYSEIANDKDNYWRLNRSKLIMEMEDSVPQFIKKHFYPKEVEEMIQSGDIGNEEEEELETVEEIKRLSSSLTEQKDLLVQLSERQQVIERQQTLILELLRRQVEPQSS